MHQRYFRHISTFWKGQNDEIKTKQKKNLITKITATKEQGNHVQYIYF